MVAHTPPASELPREEPSRLPTPSGHPTETPSPSKVSEAAGGQAGFPQP